MAYEKINFDDILDDLHVLMTKPEGRRVMYRILSYSTPLQPKMTLEPLEVARQIGREDINHGIRDAIMRTCPHLFMSMFTEGLAEAKKQAREDDEY